MTRTRMIRNNADTGNILITEPWWSWPRDHRKGYVAWWVIAWRACWAPLYLIGGLMLAIYSLAVSGIFQWPR